MHEQLFLNIGISALHVRPGKSGSHEPYMVNLVRALSELDTPHRFTIFVTPVNYRMFSVGQPHFKLVTYPPLAEKVLPRIAFEQLALPLEAFRRSIDVLHYGGTAGSFLIRRSDVVTIHHDSVTQRISMSRLRNFYFDLVLRLNRGAGLLIVPSKVYANDMTHYYGYRSEQMRAVHHGKSPAFAPQSVSAIREAQQKWGIEPCAILSVTNTLPHKNVPNLIRAFDLLLNRYGLKSQLVLVGNVKADVLSQIVSKVTVDPARLLSRIQVVPFLPNDQLPPLYGSAAIFAFVSLEETFGMPLIEAMACGLPIVASNIPVHREILIGAAQMVAPNNVEAMANAFYSILTDEVVRDELGRKALARSQLFTWRETARRTVQVYEESWRLAHEMR